MNKHEATGLAAELAGNRYWRVQQVKPATTPACAGDWWVTLEHRTGAERFLIPQCETPEQKAEVAEVLLFWGEHVNLHWPEMTLYGLRWYWPGEGAILRERGGDAC